MTKIPYNSSVTCPYCNVKQVAYSGIEDDSARPKNGDICICDKCAGVAQYKIQGGHIKLIKTDDQKVFRNFTEQQIMSIYLIRQKIMSQNDPRSTCN